MPDPRITALASLLVHYCLRCKHGDRTVIEAPTTAEPLVLELTAALLRAGAHPHPILYPARYWELFFKHASDHQLSFTPTFELLSSSQFESKVWINASANTREAQRVDPRATALSDRAWSPIWKAQVDRGVAGSLAWVVTLFPTQAYAQEAGLSLGAFEDAFYRACHVDESQTDPTHHWEELDRANEARVQALARRSSVHLRGPECDLKMSISGRTFINGSGRSNMPDGEIFTCPVEDSASGWIRFSYPSLFLGSEVSGVRLLFREGKVVEASADVGESILKSRLAQDEGASRIGELGIGTNYDVKDITGVILLDEKLGGSIHVALGLGYPEAGGLNESAIHWDLVTDFRRDTEIEVDGEIVYRNGQFLL